MSIDSWTAEQNALVAEKIRQQAINELAEEGFRRRVDAEKARILAHRSLWPRFLAWLPFTFTWK